MHPTRNAWLKAQLKDNEGKLIRYALSLTGNLSEAQDFTQESFLRLAQQKPFEPTLPWLFRVCRNLITDRFRKEKNMVEATLDDLVHPQPSPQETLETDNLTQHVLNKLKQLPAQQREIVRLKFQESLSYKEIAQITGLTPNHVGVLLHQAIKSMRTAMVKLEVTHD